MTSFASVSAYAPPATAQTPDDATTKAARARFQEGVGLFDKGQYEAARAAFLQAYALRKHPAVLLNLAQSSLRSNRPLEAAKYFQQYIREATQATPAQKADAEKGLAEARTKVGRIEVSAPTGAEISVDGTVIGAAPLSEPVDVEPGSHSVRARMTDGTSDTKSATVRAGEKLPVQISGKEVTPIVPVPPPATKPAEPPVTKPAEPPPPPEPKATEPEHPSNSTTYDVQPTKKGLFSRPKTMAPVFVGIGVAVIGAGGAVAFYAFKQDALNSAKSTAKQIQDAGGGKDTCSVKDPGRFAQACKALQDDVDRSNTDNTIANVSVGVGVAGAVFALGWYLFAAKQEDAPPPAAFKMPLITPTFGEARGFQVQSTF